MRRRLCSSWNDHLEEEKDNDNHEISECMVKMSSLWATLPKTVCASFEQGISVGGGGSGRKNGDSQP